MISGGSREEVGSRNPERIGKGPHFGDSNLALTTLDEPNYGAMESCFVRKLLLTQATLFPQHADMVTKRGKTDISPIARVFHHTRTLWSGSVAFDCESAAVLLCFDYD